MWFQTYPRRQTDTQTDILITILCNRCHWQVKIYSAQCLSLYQDRNAVVSTGVDSQTLTETALHTFLCLMVTNCCTSVLFVNWST